MYLVDYHTHSSYFSPDGRSTMEELCEAAIARGISELCVTEHCDVNGWDGKPCELDDDSYYDMLDRMRGIYGERLIILSGLELGQPTQNMDLARRYASNPRLDFIIGSLHNLEGFEDFYFLEYPDEESCRPLISRYFSEQYEMVEKADFDVLGHIGYPLRYIQGRAGISFDVSEFTEEIIELFRVLVREGKGIELNTSGLRQPYGKTMPTPDLVKLYRECGGEIITLGSDSHIARDIGAGIKEGMEILEAAGFTHFTVYRRREPQFVRI
jgi:histidinol-phosphatase (PHP family)